MNDLNYAFFEEFKHLDKLCGELYSNQHGISCYIDDMKDVPKSDYQNIPDWNTDLNQLLKLRHIRNYLAHNEGAFNEEICTQKDIEWSQEFYMRILNQSDPLAVLYKYSKNKQQISTKKKPVSQPNPLPQPVQYNTANKEIEEISIKKDEEKNIKKDEKINNFDWLVLFLLLAMTLLLVIFGFATLLK